MLTDLVVIQIIFPLLAGLVSFILPRNIVWKFASVVISLTALISIFLFQKTLNTTEPLFYSFGGWDSSIGIEYKIDKLNAFFIMMISLVTMFNIFAMKDLIINELEPNKLPIFFGIFLIAFTGLLGLCISNDIFNIYVMLEINAISSYALVASSKKNTSVRASFDYLIFGTIGSTMILFGIGFIYSLVGSLNLSSISYTFPELLDNNAAKAGIALIFFGILMKAALFPFSKWLINIYQGAPSFISAMLATTSNKVAIYLLIRLCFDVFKIKQYSFAYLDIALLLFAVFAIFTCSVLAYKQTNIKRFLAYSSLSQIGFMVFAFALANKSAISGLLIYCFSHALEKTVLFLASGYFIAIVGNEDINQFAGLIKKYRWLSILIIISLLSNIGIPMTAGFVGKWLLLKASLATDLWYIMIILLATLFSFAYAFKFIDLILFQKEKDESSLDEVVNGKACLWSLTIITFINLYIGINNQSLLNIVNQISQSVLK